MAVSALGRVRVQAAAVRSRLQPHHLAFNTSARTLASFQTLLNADAKAAGGFLKNLQATLVDHNIALSPVAQDALTRGAAAQPGELTALFNQAPALDGLTQIFDGRAATTPAATGWAPQTAAPSGPRRAATILRGDVVMATNPQGQKEIQITTAGGRKVTLHHGSSTLGNMPVTWAQGLVERSVPLAFQGDFSADGTAFHGIGYGPEAYESFMFARGLRGGNFQLPDGRMVRATDPGFLATMAKLDQWGVILPGEPVFENNQWVYKDNPASYWTLGRPSGGGNRAVAAYNTFNGVVNGPAAELAYLNHGQRNWMEGRFANPDANNQFFTTYEATLITGPTDQLPAPSPAKPVGTPLSSALYATEVLGNP